MDVAGFFEPLLGRSLLLSGQSEDFRGQCVQSVGLWVQHLGKVFPVHPSAYQFYVNGIDGFTKIPAGQPIKKGDIVVWAANFPPSKGNGHIDVAAQDGTISDFWAYDSNWDPPLRLSKIHHTGSYNNYIMGYLRLEDDMSDVADNYFIEACAEGLLGRTASGDVNLLNNLGRPKNDVLDTFRSYPEHVAIMDKAAKYDADVAADEQFVKRVYLACLGREASDEEVKANIGTPTKVLLGGVMDSTERASYAQRVASSLSGDESGFVPVSDQLYKKKG